ncbi:MAG TPA: dehydrogenase, partial [Dehalococcoidia bacterium]|nr:dehydrogenase [Dehalococcoidia bacterium]
MSKPVDFSLNGKVTIVTGGSETIGRGIALEYARNGAKVVVAARTPEKLDAIRLEIENEGGDCLTVPTNVRDS